jgi:uncharacterized membrane protein YciS (DUF1049 family)
VWSVCGSSVGFLVSYFLPALFYLKIRSKKAFNGRKVHAAAITLYSVQHQIVHTRMLTCV